MSASATPPASRTPAPRAAVETAEQAGKRALVEDATTAGIAPGSYNLIVRRREIEIWIPRPNYSATKAAFEKIFKAAGFTTTEGPDPYQPSVTRRYPTDQNGVTYVFQVDEAGGAAVMGRL